MSRILILFYSHFGATRDMAEAIAGGVESTGGRPSLKTVPAVSPDTEASQPEIPDSGPQYCSHEDLINCDGLALGSPTRFGNMAAAMKYFLDGTGPIWMNGQLIDKPAIVFTSTSSMHGGQESTLLAMMLPLLHQGMIISGLPYSEPALSATATGGTPYGVSHYAGEKSDLPLSDHERQLCHAAGARLAALAARLQPVDL